MMVLGLVFLKLGTFRRLNLLIETSVALELQTSWYAIFRHHVLQTPDGNFHVAYHVVNLCTICSYSTWRHFETDTVYGKKSFLSKETDIKILQSIYFAYEVNFISSYSNRGFVFFQNQNKTLFFFILKCDSCCHENEI